MNFVLMFDIPETKGSLKRKINRKLHSVSAIKLQQSVWKLKDLHKLTEIALTIKSEGGQATILKEDVVVPY